MTEVREGSSLYYSLLWIETEQRHRFIRRLALINTLAQTLEEVQEPSVAEQKIHWWHEELQRMVSGSSRHPATQACQSDLLSNDQAHDVLLAILSAASTLRFTPPDTEQALNSLTIQSFQARLAILSHALSMRQSDLTVADHPQQAALAFGLHEQLARLPKLIHRGLPVFSDETYDSFAIKPHDLARHIRVAPAENTTPAPSVKGIPVVLEIPQRAALVESAVDQACTALQHATESESVRTRYRQPDLLPLWRLLILRHQQLKLWQKCKPDLLRETVSLTPLAKLYRAWRHRR